MRPCASVAGTRCTRCTPRLEAQAARRRPRPSTAKMISLKPPTSLAVTLEHLELPAAPLGVALVHAEEVGREQRRLVAARAGADLDDDVASRPASSRHQRGLELVVEALRARPRAAPSSSARRAGPRRARSRRAPSCRPPRARRARAAGRALDALSGRPRSSSRPRESPQASPRRRDGSRGARSARRSARARSALEHGHRTAGRAARRGQPLLRRRPLPYFFRNLSTRPAESTNFCLPV